MYGYFYLFLSIFKEEFRQNKMKISFQNLWHSDKRKVLWVFKNIYAKKQPFSLNKVKKIFFKVNKNGLFKENNQLFMIDPIGMI